VPPFRERARTLHTFEHAALKMDDYRDLVAAGFAVLCAALMLVTWLLFIAHGTDDSRAIPQIEQPGKSGATSPLVSSNAPNPQL
jgi:hypothetical protein